ncbi:AzlC family ABC transporter permease [Arenibaculum sp.]|jgi:4-azaleucine resistance transporter AzlC|uniref:AzlC family ABC transporter permease n=1 Tax=Arenibaculum sp. TaxID=2865862 RepID=UPI002E144887|nr:AzlC family ABC transporter permease [Arenibaculum sp.]
MSRLRSEVTRGIAESVPVLLAVIAYGLVLGAQATQKGLRFLEVPLMTGSNYAGGSEFAAVGLWASPPPLLLIVGVTFLINSRHLLMGAVLTPFIQHLPRWKALVVLFFMSDESWALSYADTLKRAQAGARLPFSLGFYIGCAGTIYLGWLGSTTLGAAVGPLLGDVEAYGFDMAFPAVFLVIVAGMWKGPAAARPWLVSLVVAALTHLLVPGAWFVVAGTAAGLAAAFWSAKPR